MRIRVCSMLIAIALPVSALAQYDPNDRRRDAGPGPSIENVAYAYADVLRVDPVYAVSRVRAPREECYATEVRGSTRYDNTAAGTIVGAIIGGALGNQVGSGSGRKAATVAGAVAGGAIGREVDAASNPERVYTEQRTECRLVEDYREERHLTGYDVEYRYRGDVYMSRLNYDPGERLRIRVSVEPARP
jgi:uncharacterized protein YcfJ